MSCLASTNGGADCLVCILVGPTRPPYAPHGLLASWSMQEFRQAAQDCDFGMPASSLVADDRILQCALSKARALQQQEQQQPESVSAPAWKRQGVLLLTNDKVVQLKVRDGLCGQLHRVQKLICLFLVTVGVHPHETLHVLDNAPALSSPALIALWQSGIQGAASIMQSTTMVDSCRLATSILLIVIRFIA